MKFVTGDGWNPGNQWIYGRLWVASGNDNVESDAMLPDETIYDETFTNPNDNNRGYNEPVELNRALLSSGFAYDVKNRIEQLKIVNVLLPQIRDLRRIGSAAADICHVATGLVDGYFETGLYEWDLAAAELIAREAGAIVTTRPWHGLNLTVAAGPHLFEALNAQIPE